MTITPTAEQVAALEAFATGQPLVIEAGAGTGKTSTLRLLAESTTKACQYVAFNKSIVTEAAGKFPGHVAANTAHSLAFRAKGKTYAKRLKAPRMRSTELARRLGVQPFTVTYGTERKVLSPGYLAGLVMRAVTRFCQSADEAPGPEHLPYVDGIDVPKGDGRRGWDNNNALRQELRPAIAKAWADLMDPNGQLPYRHDHYLKAWQLDRPRIGAEVILFDEAQDANPVMAAIVAAQDHAQLVYVGDSQQQIYDFTGAVNAMAAMDGARVFLTQSFRFGPAIAAMANRVLDTLDTPMRLAGTGSIVSTVGPLAEPAAVLCRTNARAVATVLEEQAAGRRPHLIGGGAEVVSFAKAAADLQATGFTAHPDLACFSSWGEVLEYVQQDAQGAELAMLTKLVDTFGVATILEALEPGRMPAEAAADVVVSTAHKSKGREWASVALADDFPDDDVPPEGPEGAAERRLLYVAVTRAQRELDASRITWLADEPASIPLGDPSGPDDDREAMAQAEAAMDPWEATLRASLQ
jgi:hypothetical protein